MDKNFNYSSLKLGIIGGGQLGKLCHKKPKMGFHVTILDPTFNCPAAQVSDKNIMGGFMIKKIRTISSRKSCYYFWIRTCWYINFKRIIWPWS